jgi:hypothetical protein
MVWWCTTEIKVEQQIFWPMGERKMGATHVPMKSHHQVHYFVRSFWFFLGLVERSQIRSHSIDLPLPHPPKKTLERQKWWVCAQ